MAKARGTDGSLLGSLPSSLLALACSVLPHVPHIPWWITATLIICAALRMLIEKRRWHLPPPWLRVVLALGCFFGVLLTYDNISGVGPGSALLAVMAALKLLETRKRRDQFVLLFISIFLLMSSLLREQHIWSLPYILVCVTLIMAAWLQLADGTRTTMRRSVVTTARLLSFSVPLMLAMWILFPRLSSPFWAVPIDNSRSETGLSDTMSPGDVSSLSMSDEVAFRVVFQERVPERQDLYWRALVLGGFNGRTWTGGDTRPMQDRERYVEYTGRPVKYTVTAEPSARQWVYALDVAAEWTMSGAYMGTQQQLVSKRPIDQRVSYSATSYLDYRLDVNRDMPPGAYYEWLGGNSNARTRRLASRMRDAVESDEAFVRDVLHMFRTQPFYYTLEPPVLGSNPVDRFLFDTRQGFCEHYASAFAVMARAAGIPARIVLGYQGGEFNQIGDNYLIVRQSDAHAWAEVWLEEQGWVRVDPTAAVAPERINVGISGARFEGIGASWGLTTPSQMLHNLTLAWDALNAQWNRWILGYGPDNQEKLMRWLGMHEPDWRKMMLTLVAIITLLVIGISAVLYMRYRPPKKDEAVRLYLEFARKLGIQPHTGEAPASFAERASASGSASADVIHRITGLYLRARYERPDDNVISQLRFEVRKLRMRPRRAWR